ncbi:hypothetical protein ACXYTJ_07715 [Gilvimarinus sp. F26214L]|uniref:hypothetical protein n=1 Tax=Gilvimarinus sp. DZF01 TaxID=3461371 RepID=UPI0040460F32
MKAVLHQTYYLIRRELWENRSSVLWLPGVLAVLAVLFIIFAQAIGDQNFSREIAEVLSWTELSGEGDQEETRRIDFSRGVIVSGEGENLDWLLWGPKLLDALQPGLHAIALAFELVAFIVAIFYLLSTLFGDRKDRSILFWKSLPFSETNNVLSKLLFASLVIPVAALVIAIAVQLVFGLSVVRTIVASTDFGYFEVLGRVSFLSVFVFHLLLVLVFALKNLPLFSWLLFASSVSKRSPFLTAVIPIVALGSLEALVLGSDYFYSFVESLFFNNVQLQGDEDATLQEALSTLLIVTPGQLVRILAVSTPLLIGAVWLRNNRYEI